jgi:ankyrin repeat protein
VSRGKYDSKEHGVGIARLLLEHGVDVHARDKDHDTALHSAALRGRLEITRILLDHYDGANANPENKQGETPLHLVSRGEYNSQEHGVSITRLVLERGVDVNAPDKDQNTPLHYASYFGKPEIAQVLPFSFFFLKKQKKN